MTLNKRFESEAEEARYWQEHPEEFEAGVADAPAFRVADVFPDLARSTERVNIRMPAPLVARIKQVAAQRDIPYQSLLKTVLFDAFFPELAIKKASSPTQESAELKTRAAKARRGRKAAVGKNQHVVPRDGKK